MARMNKTARRRTALLIVMGTCVIISAVLLMNMQTPPGATSGRKPPEGPDVPVARAPEPVNPEPVTPAPTPAPTVEAPPVETPPAAPPVMLPAPGTEDAIPGKPPAPVPMEPATEADLKYLRSRNLLIPVEGVGAAQLRDSYYDGRSEGRTHEALDIMAPQNTPVLATTDGTVAKLFQSDKGGITLYQLDQSGLYYLYYAHLSRYADGIYEGKQLKRGEVIGYVGDTGNAGAGNFHLHFAIQKPKAPGKWSGGFPINPYSLLIEKP